MNLIRIVILLLISFQSNPQSSNGSVGISLDAGIATFTNANSTIDKYNLNSLNNQIYTKSSIWNIENFSLDYHFPKNRFTLSVGARLFNMHYIVDSVLLMTGFIGYDSFFGAQITNKSYVLPTLSMEFCQELNSKLSLSFKTSIGIMSIADQYTYKSTGYAPNQEVTYPGIDNFDERPNFQFNAEMDVTDITLGSSLNAHVGLFRFSVGPTFYYFRRKSDSSIFATTNHFGLYFNAGISLRFKKKNVEVSSEYL